MCYVLYIRTNCVFKSLYACVRIWDIKCLVDVGFWYSSIYTYGIRCWPCSAIYTRYGGWYCEMSIRCLMYIFVRTGPRLFTSSSLAGASSVSCAVADILMTSALTPRDLLVATSKCVCRHICVFTLSRFSCSGLLWPWRCGPCKELAGPQRESAHVSQPSWLISQKAELLYLLGIRKCRARDIARESRASVCPNLSVKICQ